MKPRFADIRDRLRFVRMARDDYDLERFPDFLIIGPLRTGTTWLQECLVEHPEVFIPSWKEVHYFSNLEHPEFHPKHMRPVEQELGWYLDCFEVPLPHRKRRERECRERYDCGYTPRVFGEATATYAAGLHEALIAEVLLLNPDIKILTMVRNPIDRAWSNAKKNLCKERDRAVADVGEAEWFEFFAKDFQVHCGNFTTFIPRWQQLVPAGNMFVGRFVDVAADPAKLLTDVYAFLGIAADARLVPPVARRPVGGTEKTPRIPPACRARLEELFGDEVLRLREQGLIG